MKKTYWSIYISLILFLTLSISACNVKIFRNQQIPHIDTPHTSLFRNYPNYLVSNVNYMRFYKEKKAGSEVLNIIRKGEFFIVVKPEGQDRSGYFWYQIINEGETGWVLMLDPILTHSLAQAKQFKKSLSRSTSKKMQ